MVQNHSAIDFSFHPSIGFSHPRVPGASLRRVDDFTEALWATRVSSEMVSQLNQQIYKWAEDWHQPTNRRRASLVYLDGLVPKSSYSGEVRNVSVLAAISDRGDDHHQVLVITDGHKEN